MTRSRMTNPRSHRRGHLRALIGPAWDHLRRWLRDPDYRALQSFHRCLRSVDRFTTGSVSYSGRTIVYLDSASFLSAWEEIFVNHCYQIVEGARRPFLLDVGANIGLAALAWKKWYGDFRYIGIEADPDAAAICRQNLAAWDINGEVLQRAVTATGDSARFRSDHADGGKVEIGQAVPGVIEIGAIRLSSFLVESVDLLKIDIEGAELSVLREARDRLDCVRNLFVEFHARTDETTGFGELLTILEAAGFRCVVHPVYVPEHPFKQAFGREAGFAFLANVFATRDPHPSPA